MPVRIAAKTDRNAADRIAQLSNAGEAWSNSGGSFYGRSGAAWDGGRLDSADEIAATRKATYVIYSYATPVAWRNADGSWTKTAQRFSVTTSQHQGRLYRLT